MGYGEFVGNESVHFGVTFEDETGRETGSVRGRDPIKFGDIGTKPRKGRPAAAAKSAPAKTLLPKPSFRVRLMYPTKELAQRAKDSAEIVEIQGSYFLLLNAPAVRRKSDRVDPPQPPAEVRVDW
jgi:hypothetical protein